MSVVSKIVLTGGPCAGKTTALAKIEKNLTEQGYKVFIVGESATELIKGGIRPFGDDSVEGIDFQRLILDYQFNKEKIYEQAGKLLDKKSVIIYDRGLLDNKAYINQEIFTQLLQEKGLTELNLMDNYDLVLHLVTAADGAEEFYTLENNEARSESVEEATLLDKKTANAWLGHSNQKIIDNSYDFEDKMNKTVAHINNLLNNTETIKKQRKFVVDLDNSNLSFLNQDTSTVINITQTYLESNDDFEYRIRKREYEDYTTYFMTIQRKCSNGVSKVVTEKKISKKEYQRLLESSPTKRSISKTRTSFIYDKECYRLDIFENNLALLEVEVNEDTKEIKLPKEITVLEEVTERDDFKNYSLAEKEIQKVYQ